MNLKLHFPHPILNEERDDYQSSIFVNNCYLLERSKIENKYIFETNIINTNKELRELIDDKALIYSVKIECPKTYYSKSFNFTDSKNIFEIDPENVEGLIRITTFIIALNDIDEFYSSDFHQDFHQIKFDIKLGEILAVHKTGYLIDEKESEREAPVNSIFTFRKNDEFANNGFNYEVEEKIIVYLNEDNYIRFSQLQANVEDSYKLLHSLYIVPILTSILSDIRNIGDVFIDEHLSQKWMQSLLKLFESKNISKEELVSVIEEYSPIGLAQEVIDYPMKDSLIYIESILEIGG